MEEDARERTTQAQVNDLRPIVCGISNCGRYIRQSAVAMRIQDFQGHEFNLRSNSRNPNLIIGQLGDRSRDMRAMSMIIIGVLVTTHKVVRFNKL